MQLEITPVQSLAASVRPPGSKSITNRALLCAALSDGRCVLNGVLDSDDTQAMILGLSSLGICIDHDSAACVAVVHGDPERFAVEDSDVFCGNSGTTIRFLCAAATLGRARVRLDGNNRMRTRPIGDLLTALTEMGGELESENGNDCPPVIVRGGGLSGGHVVINGAKSSQFISAALMAAPAAAGPVVIDVEELVSQPYVEMTLAVMKSFGVEVKRTQPSRFEVEPASYRASDYSIEPDASAASYFWAAAAVTAGTVRVEGLTKQALQGDVGFCKCLAEMGCTVEDDSSGITVHGTSELTGINVNMKHISDTAQTLAVVALFADGPTTITGVEHIRRKETDRIADLARELRKCGARVDEFEDGLRIHPAAPMRPATIETYDDHRMAMSFAVAGLRQPGMVIDDPLCVAKTYPAFFKDLERVCRE